MIYFFKIPCKNQTQRNLWNVVYRKHSYTIRIHFQAWLLYFRGTEFVSSRDGSTLFRRGRLKILFPSKIVCAMKDFLPSRRPKSPLCKDPLKFVAFLKFLSTKFYEFELQVSTIFQQAYEYFLHPFDTFFVVQNIV